MNFLVIVPDDLGWGDVPWHGHEWFQISAPQIANLASQGLRLERFYGSYVCTPARAAMMTGRFPFRLGCQQTIWPWTPNGVPLNEVMLPQILTAAGYDTYQVGKWHLGHGPGYKPMERGFQHQFGFLTGCDDYWNHDYYGVPDLMRDGVEVKEPGHLTDLFGQETVNIINNLTPEKPFFIYLAFNAPHLPLDPAPAWVPVNKERVDPNRRNFAALVSHMDDWIGKIVQALQARNLLDDTFIWFRGDNGGWLPYGATNFPLRGGKTAFYEGGIRVPAFVYYTPMNQNKDIWQTMCGEDMLPTICSLAGITALPPNLDGVDVSPYFNNPATPTVDRTIIHLLSSSNWGCITKGPWKLLVPNYELYNVEHDIDESSDWAILYQSVIDDLVKTMRSYLPPVPESRGGPDWPAGFVAPKYWGA